MSKIIEQTKKSLNRRVTLAEIAKLVGVSRVTVGYVLNGKAEKMRIAPKTQKKILKIAHEQGYLANFAVKQLRSSKTFQIAYVCNPMNLKSVHPAVLSMINFLQKQNYHTSFIFTENTPPAVMEHRFDGMVIDGVCSTRQFFIDWCEKYKIPYIFLNHEGAAFDHVGVDDKETMIQLINELYEMGFRKLAYYFPREISSNPLFPPDYIFKREEYFIDALKAKKLVAYPNSVEQRQNSNSLFESLMTQSNHPECVVTYDTFHAIGFIDKAKSCGLNVPDDVAVVAFHFDNYNKSIEPAICGIKFDFNMIGENMADMILNKIKTGKDYRAQLNVGKLLVKSSGVLLESLNFFNK
jgi:LacI family transcriptional regulator, galactose operon repressor